MDKITPYINTSHIVAASIAEFLPNAKVIQLVRDGRDVITSGVFHWLTKAKEDVETDEITRRRKAFFLNRDTTTPLERFFSDSDLEEWCPTWSQPIESVATLSQTNPVLRISYEDMIQNQSAVLKKVFVFLGANSSDNVVYN
ncbi:MAG: sulfotransferase, partial [Moorea sp. SIO2B7]|nr:sulfotransferase [Moorena sp. SIO2B7]